MKISLLKWSGHVLRMEDTNDCIIDMETRRTSENNKDSGDRKKLGEVKFLKPSLTCCQRGNWKECTAALWTTRLGEDR